MTSLQPSSSASGGKPDRLFVGNLAPNVDEYTLVQVFQKYGKITKLDVMYHKTGPLKGKSRGYAFVEYSSKDVRSGKPNSCEADGQDALKALVKLHDRLLRGRKLVVTYANAVNSKAHMSLTRLQAPPDDYMNPKARRVGDAAKPTTLSLLKAKNRPRTYVVPAPLLLF
jgi:RNA recognition motif-containing protein